MVVFAENLLTIVLKICLAFPLVGADIISGTITAGEYHVTAVSHLKKINP